MAKRKTRRPSRPTAKLALAVVEDLMSDGFGAKADRLVLMKGALNLGGWSRSAVLARLLWHLKEQSGA